VHMAPASTRAWARKRKISSSLARQAPGRWCESTRTTASAQAAHAHTHRSRSLSLSPRSRSRSLPAAHCIQRPLAAARMQRGGAGEHGPQGRGKGRLTGLDRACGHLRADLRRHPPSLVVPDSRRLILPPHLPATESESTREQSHEHMHELNPSRLRFRRISFRTSRAKSQQAHR
jgi:hypothetical protein